MKKLMLTLCLLVGTSFLGRAQEDVTIISEEVVDSVALLKEQLNQANAQLSAEEEANRELRQELKWNSIWGKGKYTMLSYGVSARARQEGLKFTSDWNFGISKGTSYFFPKRPLAGMVKVGFDVRWCDISVTKYKNSVSYDYGSSDWEDDGEFSLDDLGHYDLHAGVFGIGPVASIAPLSHLDNSAKYLRGTLYFHYQPTIGLNLFSEGGEMSTSTAYCNMWDFGFKVQYRRIALGFETRWGSGKYSNMVSSDDFEEDFDYGYNDDDEPKGKIKRKFNTSRLYIAFTF